ncbi:MAG: flippase-like domain-containing protein [Chitinophagaceae bacterium]|nr:MAG: flippase-like domain-containing protein [Chitinophagaceae bacterium]
MKFKNRHKKNINLFMRFFLGPLLFAWLCWSIYGQLGAQSDLALAWKSLRSSFGLSSALTLALVSGLMIINWTLEAYKWKLLVGQIQRVSLLVAFKAILSGVAFAVTTPNRVGEYLGRILYMEEGNRLRAISMTITGSVSQLIVTLVMGLTGIMVLGPQITGTGMVSAPWLQMLKVGTALATVLLTLFYFRIPFLVRTIDRLPGKHRFNFLVSAMERYDATLLLRVLSLSATRFLVFVIQYYLLFRLFSVELTWFQATWAVSVSFLVLAAVPTIALFTDLGMRGEVMLQLVSLYSGNRLGIGLAAITIWLVNLILPALAGSLLILGIRRIFKNKNSRDPMVEETVAVKETT